MNNKGNTKIKTTSGITLIALIITIVILLILASATINIVLGDDGIIKTAKNTVIADVLSKKREQVEIAIASVFAEKKGVKANVTVEKVLGEIQKASNSTEIYAVKENGVITQAEGTTKFPASILFPKETTGLDDGIRIDVDENLKITDTVTTEVDSVSGALANVEVNKANLELNLIWENGTPKVTYRETTGADVTIQYMIGTSGTLKNATGGVISEATLKLGDTVFVIVSKEGKQKDGGSVLVIDETDPVITKFEIKETTEDSITVEVTATDNESGLATTNTYTYYKDGTQDGESSTSTTHTYASLTAGTHKLKVEVADKAGRKASTEIDGTIEQTTGAGIYDADGTMLASWNTLINDYNLNVEKDYDYSTYDKNNTDGNSMYYVLQQSPFSGKTGLTVVMPGSNPETAVINTEMDIVNSYEIASTNEGVRVATTSNQITKIGNYAFRECSALTSVTIPDSVTSIGSSAFSVCSGLTSVEIPDSVTSIGSSAFQNCRALTSVTIPDSVTSIEEYAFNNCSRLTSVTIPNSVTSIKGWAFQYCRALTSVTIPNSVTSIHTAAFSTCSALTSVTIPDSVTSIGWYAFSDCSKLTSVTIPDSVTSIGNYAFNSCSALTSVTIPDSVTSIPDGVFNSCSGLTSVTIGNSVTSIGSRAFQDCSGLTSVTIGNSVTSISWYAFSACSKLTSVTIPDSVTSIDNTAFYECSNLTSVTIGSGLEDIYAIQNISSLTKIEISPNNPNYTIIDNVVYSKDGKNLIFCLKVKTGEVIILDSVTSIGNNAFSYCSKLTSITIGNSVTSIGSRAFFECSALTSVTIGNSVTSIGMEAFYSCSALTSVEIPDSVTSIGEYAFRNCMRLRITVPDTVESIYDKDVFEGCESVSYERSDWRSYYYGESESGESGESGEIEVEYDSNTPGFYHEYGGLWKSWDACNIDLKPSTQYQPGTTANSLGYVLNDLITNNANNNYPKITKIVTPILDIHNIGSYALSFGPYNSNKDPIDLVLNLNELCDSYETISIDSLFAYQGGLKIKSLTINTNNLDVVQVPNINSNYYISTLIINGTTIF